MTKEITQKCSLLTIYLKPKSMYVLKYIYLYRTAVHCCHVNGTHMLSHSTNQNVSLRNINYTYATDMVLHYKYAIIVLHYYLFIITLYKFLAKYSKLSQFILCMLQSI